MKTASPKASSFPKVTFGIIVLNGEPFTRYNLRALYPWAHQIIVVEGACNAAVEIATHQGHSTDHTLEVLRRFKKDEDPANKLVLVTAEDEGHPNGFWPGEKREMSQSYAKRATGDFLWQADIDEFWNEKDFPIIFDYLSQGYTQISFPMLSFWGGINYIEDGKYFRLYRANEIRRVFKWDAGSRYTTHRPATVLNSNGVDVSTIRPLEAITLRKNNVYYYHYSMVFPKQVTEKCRYYSKADWGAFDRMNEWAQNAYFNLKTPYSVHNSQQCTTSWLERYEGGHPKEVLQMMAAIEQGAHPDTVLRKTDDIERLLDNLGYNIGRVCLKYYVHLLVYAIPLKRILIKHVSQAIPSRLKRRIR